MATVQSYGKSMVKVYAGRSIIILLDVVINVQLIFFRKADD